MEFLGVVHWFMLIRISHIKDHYISVDKDMYATSIVAKYLNITIFKTSTMFYKTNLTSDIILLKADEYTSYEKVEKLTRQFNIQYRACIGSLMFFICKSRFEFFRTQVSKVFIKFC